MGHQGPVGNNQVPGRSETVYGWVRAYMTIRQVIQGVLECFRRSYDVIEGLRVPKSVPECTWVTTSLDTGVTTSLDTEVTDGRENFQMGRDLGSLKLGQNRKLQGRKSLKFINHSFHWSSGVNIDWP
jgi:hypothetical protein